MNTFQQELQKLEDEGLLRKLRQVESAQGPRIVVNGKEAINLCSNDYLGLANHHRLKEAAIKAIEKYGIGSGASRLISGTTKLHAELEERLARFKGAQAALVFNSGYAANVGIISALAGRGDVIFSDKLNHASIVDGCLLSGAELRRYPHKDIAALERILKKYVGRSTTNIRRLIITDTIFSMDGDIVPLPELVKLAEKYRCMLMIDEAHATGVLGEKGKGAVEYFGLEKEFSSCGNNFVQMGTLSKALGSFGAYAAGSRGLIDYLINKSKAFIYTTALPASVISAGIAALDIVESQPQLRLRLFDNVRFFKDGLKKIGADIMQSQTQIMPILIGGNDKAVMISERLLRQGVFMHAVRPPTVPKGTARLRAAVSAAHTREDLDYALRKIKKYYIHPRLGERALRVALSGGFFQG